ncbi:MAG: tRNA 4-thiouridine(8) synthase ThiI [Anaerolineae bacterium]|nr:tRNA 4-thiouridine(8) synthase ThiI [Anaerolineae bacterium]
MSLILVRYVGEIGIKGKNRHLFVKRLRRNMRDALRKSDLRGSVWSDGQRIFVEVDDSALARATQALRRVFGIASLSPVERVPSDIDALCEAALQIAARIDLKPPTTFRVQTRRADKTFPLTSPEISRQVGGAVYETTRAPVDLSNNADMTIGVEVRAEGAFIFGEIIPGEGGMPLGSQGRVFVLLSGGIDSPVAAWLMMRRGCGIIPIFWAQNEIERAKVLQNCAVLSGWSFGWEIKPIILDHNELMTPIVDRLHEIGEERWSCILCKRAMLAQAAELAPRYGVQALVMGDSLGQVASQTLNNIATISWGTDLPILRPLIACDKQDIMTLARRIGTFDVSIQDALSCAYVPDRPITNADRDRLQVIVARLKE